MLFMLPDVPSSAWFLTEQERIWAIARLSENVTGIETDKFKRYQACEAFKTWILFLIEAALNITNGTSAVNSPYELPVAERICAKTLVCQMLICLLVYIDNLPWCRFQQRASIFIKCRAFPFHACRQVICCLGKLTREKYSNMLDVSSIAFRIIGAALVRELPRYYKWGRYAGTILSVINANNYGLLASVISSNYGGVTKKSNALGILSPELLLDGRTRALIRRLLADVHRFWYRKCHRVTVIHRFRVAYIQMWLFGYNNCLAVTIISSAMASPERKQRSR